MSTRFQPYQPVFDSLHFLQNEMNRLFHPQSEEGFAASGAFPPINMWEDGDELFITAELPGQSLEDLEILVTGQNQLTIKGERKPPVFEKAVRHRQERVYGKFTRTFPLPFAVDADKVEAELQQGVLRLKLAKHESAKSRKIQVRGE